MHENRERAGRIQNILNTVDPYNDDGGDSPEAMIGDLLADIMHFCYHEDIEFNDRIRMAAVHFNEELEEERCR